MENKKKLDINEESKNEGKTSFLKKK